MTVLAEKQIRDAIDLLAFLQSFDLESVYLRNETPKGNLVGNAQLIEDTLSDGSKVRDIVLT
jgi:hypothetical protein